MEKLGRSLVGGPSKKELLETVAAQRRELAHYQARLGDVVRAYKGLLAEKAALEAGLRALSSAAPPDDAPGGPPLPVGGGEEGAGGEAEEESGPPAPPEEEEEEEEEGAPPGSGSSRGVARLRAQLATVTGALAALSREKSRVEASYQADKRRARQELEELRGRAGEERGELRAAREQLAETKARLLAQQHDRAQEQSDHAVMLRELQRLLQAERAQREEAERALDAARDALAGAAGAADRLDDAERQARRLAREAEGLRRALRAARDENGRPDPQLRELRDEVAALKGHCQAQLLQEMRKTAQAEERVQMEEQRVTGLEVQMSEVSELLGTYEKAKQKDQVAIHKLKDRIAQLDLENKTLALAASGRSPLEIPPEESDWDVNLLREKMEKLRQLVQAAAKDGQCPPAPEAFPLPEPPGDAEKASAAYYQQELKQLKEEFERYKLRAQVVLKNKSAKDGSLARELEGAQEQLAELKEKYISLWLSGEAVEKQHREELEARKQELCRLQQLHRQELEKCQAACGEKVLTVEEEMHKQRDRALAVLAEKDRELEQLRTVVLPPGLQGAKKALAPGPRARGSDGQDPPGTESLESLTQALRLTAPTEPGFLLYTEQLARKEVAVAALQKEKRRLEAEAHQLQERLLEEGERHREEVSALQGQVQKSFRDQGREGANLEYLKNIFYRFLTLADSLGRQQTLTAILTILHFSPQERQVVLTQLGGGHSWWHSGR